MAQKLLKNSFLHNSLLFLQDKILRNLNFNYQTSKKKIRSVLNYGNKVKDADNKGCDIELSKDGIIFAYRLGARERNATAGVCSYTELISSKTFEYIIDNLQCAVSEWKKFNNTTLNDESHQVKALVDEFNKKLGL